MDKTLLCALVVAFFYWIKQVYFGYTLWELTAEVFPQCLAIGLIYGDVPKAMIIGAGISLMYLGINAPGGQLPADKYIATAIAVPLAMQTNMKAGVAIALAVPLAMIGAQLLNLKKVLQVGLVPIAERQVDNGDISGLTRTALLYPMILGIPLFFLPVFVSVMFGSKVVTPIMNAIPDWLMHGLVISGGLLPAVGFSLTLMMIGKDKYIPYFILGFILVAVLKIPTIVAAVIAGCVATAILVMKQELHKENSDTAEKSINKGGASNG